MFFALLIKNIKIPNSNIGNTSIIVGIIGGNYISIEEAPYQVSLIIRPSSGRTNICGGQIIHEFFTLSASHCFEYLEVFDLVSIRWFDKFN